MSSKAIVDTIVSNFNDNFKSVNAILDNNVIYQTRSGNMFEKGGTKISNSEYLKLRQYHTYLSNSIKELDKIKASERINLRNNEQALNKNEAAVTKKDMSLRKTRMSLNNKKDLVNTRSYQYELAIKRNEHRRQMVIMLAVLNTLGLMIYYFTSK